MKEKFRFREISRLIFPEIVESNEEIEKDFSKPVERIVRGQQIELPIYDISLEQFVFPAKYKLLNTKVKEIVTKQITTPLFDISITQHVIKQPSQMPLTKLTQIPREKIKVADIRLFTIRASQLSPSLGTEIKNLQKSMFETKSITSFFDLNLNLESKTLLKQISKLNTELATINVESGLEDLSSSERQLQLPIFEEFINCDKKFPRSFSESFNSPFVVLIGEDEKEWHIPLIYALKELFREITDKHPRITFREPELLEEGVEEVVDSLDLHSLDQFTFEYKIEFLDARRMHLAVDEFAKMVRGRLKSGFLQQFGVLVVAVKPEDLEKAKDALKVEGLHIYVCKPEDDRYETFCSKILGLSSLDKFFDGLKKYERHLEYTTNRFSIFVKRSADAADKLQYPLKVATFIYLLNDLRGRRKKVINNFEELCEFVKGVLEEGIIKVEEKVNFTSPEGREVIPDITYSPEGKEFYVEIETLIGTFEPLKKIDETVEKYKNCPNATIWVILKPISALLHYEELKARKKAYKILYNDKNIEFKVLTLLTSKERFRWSLMNIDEFIGDKNVK